MNRQEAIRLLDETFNADFDTMRYSRFVKELFNVVSIVQQDKTPYIANQYREYISEFRKIGEYEDADNKKMEILTVKLKRTSSRDRARTMQRNFIATWLGKMELDSALVAFYGEDPEDWRFSYVKMEYHLEKNDKGEVKIAKELTPAKRYSFLVGVNEPNHTCRSRLVDIVMEETTNPLLIDIENAFSIDNVTKEFFEKYKELYLKLKESLEEVISKDENIKKEFETKGISTIDFSKKLLGQIVFIYFLQKKGWLGVCKNNDGTFREWGTGPKYFLRRLFNKDIVPYTNFFNDILEPLFYEALANDRSADNDYYSRFKCKIPFLNGGLFEPINEYDWTGTEILLDNSIFENILDTFDRFNFTVKEDEPLEKEVAVDPEMLGKVFENLLEVTDRKSKGAFYTPREIVHYMCQQSLINYLETNSSISHEDLTKFIQMGDIALDQTIRAMAQKKVYSGRTYHINEQKIIPNGIEENYRSVDKLLQDIKIVDPAVGSGAFPVGMMNEIIKARSILSIYFTPEEQEKRTDYNLKRETIENSLYGVDIEPSAVEIAKLRFWLSLIVEETDIKNIKPLPNLDHKIMCGNSLLEEFEGIKLFDDKIFSTPKWNKQYEIKEIINQIEELKKQLPFIKTEDERKKIDNQITKLKKKKSDIEKKSDTEQISLTESESEKKIKHLKLLQKRYFNEQNRKNKKQLRDDIERIEWDLIESTLKEQGNDGAMHKLTQYKKNKAKPFFLWKLYFSEIFLLENPGFDVVIANPPYVSAWSMEAEDSNMRNQIKNCLKEYNFLSGHWDLYIAFVARGNSLLRNKGTISYIIPNPILREKYATETREFLLEKMQLQSILEYNDVNVFENVARRTSVLVCLNKSSKNYEIKIYGNKQYHNGFIELINTVKMEDWLKNHNHQFLIMGNKTEDDLILKLEKKSEKIGNYFYVNYGVQVSSKEKGKFGKKEVVGKIPNGNSKPFYEGKDVQRWHLRYRDLWLDYRLNELYGPRTPELFENEKIVIRKVSNKGHKISGTLDISKKYTDDGNVIIIPYQKIINTNLNQNYKDYHISKDILNLKYVLAFILSNIETFYFKKKYATESLQGSTSHTYPASVRGLLIKNINPEKQKLFIHIVDQILIITDTNDYLDNSEKQTRVKELEKEINQLLYTLYELTETEILLIKKNVGE